MHLKMTKATNVSKKLAATFVRKRVVDIWTTV
jgi:hypothetical protein